MFATWISRHLYSIFDADRVFEEMDAVDLESRILEREEDVNTNYTWILATAGVTVTVATTVATVTRHGGGYAGFAVLGGITVAAGSTVAIGRWWIRWKSRAARRITVAMERTRAALRRRRQLYFSISMRLPPHRNPLIVRCCRLAVSAIETLATETTVISAADGSPPSWTDLYTPEIRMITARSARDSEKLAIEDEGEEGEEDTVDFDTVFETLISVFKLHASEYSRLVISNFLENFKFKSFRNFLKTCSELDHLQCKIRAIESLALSTCSSISNKEKSAEKREKNGENRVEIGWKQQTAMAIEAILEGLQNDTFSRHEVEMALRRTLVIIGTESALKTENPEEKSATIERLKGEIEEGSGEAVAFVKGEKMDVDMVFEGTPLSEADKLIASKNACAARDVLLDGSESRRHEASLMGELQMVLEPRRTDFARRERRALAKFYGVEEEKLGELEEKEEKGKQGEETFSGIGIGGDGDAEAEAYDWRKDAEQSCGLHREADNIDFLTALAARRVKDDVIE